MLVTSCFILSPAGSSAEEDLRDATNLNLEQAIEYALQHNRSLQNAKLGLSSSEMSVKSAESSFDLKVLPLGSIGFSSDDQNSWLAGATLSKSFTTGADFSVSPRVRENDDDVTADVAFSLNVPLLQGAGKEFAMSSVFSSRYAYETAKFSYYSQQISTILQTVTRIYASIRTNLQIQLLEKQMQMLRGHLALAKIKERSGIISALDLYRAEIRYNDVQNELTSVKELHADNLDSVKDVLGIPQSGKVVVSAPLEFEAIQINLEEALVIAQANRIEIDRADSSLREKRRLLGIAKNDLLPQLNVQLGYNLSGENVFEELEEESWSITFESDTDLFRTTEQNVFRQNQIQVRQALLDLESSRENVNQQVRSELNSLEKQKSRIDLREKQVQQTVGKLMLSQSKFEHGMTDNFVLIEAQTELQEAQTNHLFERINYIIGMYRLRAALGTLMDRSSTQ